MPWIKYISQPAIADISFDKHSTLGLAFPLIHITFLHRLVSHHDQDSKLNLNANPVEEQEKKKKEGITDWHKNGENKTSHRVGREERIKSWGKFDQILMKVIHSNIVSHSSFIDSVIDFESRICGGFLEWRGRILKIHFSHRRKLEYQILFDSATFLSATHWNREWRCFDNHKSRQSTSSNSLSCAQERRVWGWEARFLQHEKIKERRNFHPSEIDVVA